MVWAAAHTDMERRRRQPPAWDGTIACRSCSAPVALRRAAIARGSDGRVRTRCTGCGAVLVVRVSDPALDVARVVDDVIAPPATSERRRIRALLSRHR